MQIFKYYTLLLFFVFAKGFQHNNRFHWIYLCVLCVYVECVHVCVLVHVCMLLGEDGES